LPLSRPIGLPKRPNENFIVSLRPGRMTHDQPTTRRLGSTGLRPLGHHAFWERSWIAPASLDLTNDSSLDAGTGDDEGVRLLVIFGPPAVGKMAVGAEVARRGGLRLFHNHAVMEPLLEVFDYGTPPFNTLLKEFRLRVMEEGAASETDLVVTYVWGLQLAEDAAYLSDLMAPYVGAGAEVAFVELYADLETRLARNRSEQRLDAKKSKRDVEWSDGNVRELEEHVMNTSADVALPADELLSRYRHLRLDNTDVPAGQAAEQILTWLGG
jgi:hypothetical protein